MTYLAWYEAHAQKHSALVALLIEKGLDEEAIIAYFDYDNMVEKEPDFCLLYTQGKKCHEMEHLNCYLCACPNFRFDDAGLKRQGPYTIASQCSIGNGKTYGHDGIVHQDCSNCTVPHHTSYIRKHFDRSWRTIMRESPPRGVTS
ncbi:MAG: hypothetical protein KU37_03605 [Sulfuricurvum sp. PC08-66]|nr:MAG: hypothetical protein KU37_03605 [Sulfuricurvum sp. PC08-66]